MAKKKIDKIVDEVEEIIDAADKGVTVFGEKVKRGLKASPLSISSGLMLP